MAIVTGSDIGHLDRTGHIIGPNDIGTPLVGGGIRTGDDNYHRYRALPAPPPITHSRNGITTVPLILQKSGSKLRFPVSYTMELNDKMSASEYRDIMSTLNEVARRSGPDFGSCTMVLMLLPCTGFCTMMSRVRQAEELGFIFEETIHEINKQHNGRVNLRLIHADAARGCRIDMEVGPLTVIGGPPPILIANEKAAGANNSAAGTVWGTVAS